jgi:ribosomal protein S18 acetylase RimI-like enzyme
LEIKSAADEDVAIIDEIIRRQFPYTKIPQERISKKIKDKNFLIFAAYQENIFMGFAEFELLGEEARLNGIYVEEAWRGQKVATKLVKRALHECNKKHFRKVFLLVKETNEGAKKLYQKTGFRFEKMHDREIDGSKVEIWSVKI